LIIIGIGALSLLIRYRQVLLPEHPANVWKYSLPTTFWFFVPGMLLALLRASAEPRLASLARMRLANTDLWFAGAVLLWLVAAIHPTLDPLVAVGSFLVVGACVLPLRPGVLHRALGWRGIAALGIASYSLYMWQSPVLRWLTSPTGYTSAFLGLLSVGLPILVVIALASYRGIEFPFLRLRRQWAPSSASQAPDDSASLDGARRAIP
jgi:peptidoglycan/LPS O-acetylase OafA/YrhL